MLNKVTSRLSNFGRKIFSEKDGLEQWFSTGAMPYFWGATGKSRKIGGGMETVKWATKSSPLK
jgi:hypothetical protein